MPTRLRILGNKTLATSYTDVYVCGSAPGGFTAADAREGIYAGIDTIVDAFVGSIIFCEKNNTAATIDVRVIPRSETPSDSHLIFDTLNIGPNKTKIITPSISMSFEDRIQVKASTVNVNMFIFGSETS